VEIAYYQFCEEAQHITNTFETTSSVNSGPWIPIMPKSDELPDLAGDWQGFDEHTDSLLIRGEA
jgi:hypothetical protein